MAARFLWLLCIFLLSAAQTAFARESPVCGDFLALAGKNPASLEFLECKPAHEAQLRVLVAKYRVRGRDAAEMERHFRRTTGMGPLSFNCCFWEPVPRKGVRYGQLAHTRAKEGTSEWLGLTHYEIAMISEETLHSSRDEWLLIPWFYVTVTRFLDEP